MELGLHVLEQHLLSPFQVFTVDNLFDEMTLKVFDEFINECDTHTPTFTNSPFRNGKIKNYDVSGMIWKALSSVLPKVYYDVDGQAWEFVGVADVVMFAEIPADRQFGLHTDTGYVFENSGDLVSSHTVLIYLNHDFEGGHTQFVDDGFRDTVAIEPSANRLLAFDIRLWHRGKTVTSGVKRWIGTELVSKKYNIV